jgi:deoxyribonuclease V
MNFRNLHPWDLAPAEAVALQRELAGQVDTRTPLTRCRLVAGVDVSYARFSARFFAGIVVLEFPELNIVERVGAVRETPFPYIPGLLSFRETPALLEAFVRLQTEPDVVMADGQGLAHPRRFGIACHLGLWLDLPCFGCAKSLLTGRHKELGNKAGSLAPLVDKGDVVGEAVRTKDGVKPVYVSAGHKIDLPSAVRVALETCRGYRIPEPTRQAHRYVNALRRGEVE